MKASQLIDGAAYPPDALKIIFAAFDEAWAELAPEISTRPEAMETSRASLAAIVLRLAKLGPIDRKRIKTDAVDAFRWRHRLKGPNDGC